MCVLIRGLGLGSKTVVTCLIRTVRPIVCASVRGLGLGSKTVVTCLIRTVRPIVCASVRGLGLGSKTVVTCLIRTVRPIVCASVRGLGLGSKTVVVYWGMQAEPRAYWFIKFIDMKVNDRMCCHSSKYIYCLFCCKWLLCKDVCTECCHFEQGIFLLSCIIDMFYITLQTPTAVYVHDMCLCILE